MSNTMSEMDQIVKFLRDKGSMSEEDIQAYIDKLRESREGEKKTVEKREEPKFILNDRAATLVFPSGYSVAITKEGSIQWAYDGKKIDPSRSTPLIYQHEMEMCLQHIIGLYAKERKELWNSIKHYKDASEQIKTRYMNKGQKKAFVAGMILGRKEAS